MNIADYYPLALTILGCVVTASIGFRFPDIDLAPVLPLRHRSAWTHGPFMALGVLALVSSFPSFRIYALTFLAGLTIHLLEDAAPKEWRGSAHINLFPLPFSLPVLLSQLYIVSGVVVSAWVITRVIQ